MFENVIRFIAKIGEAEGHFIMPNGVDIPVIEQMLMQIIQAVGIAKANQLAAMEAEKKAGDDKSEVQKVDESKVESIQEQPKE